MLRKNIYDTILSAKTEALFGYEFHRAVNVKNITFWDMDWWYLVDTRI